MLIVAAYKGSKERGGLAMYVLKRERAQSSGSHKEESMDEVGVEIYSQELPLHNTVEMLVFAECLSHGSRRL